MHQLNYQRTLNLGIVMSVQPNFNIKSKYTHFVNVSLSLNQTCTFMPPFNAKLFVM
jgi:hypothetical protein